jgi:hypothetical protein
MEGTMSKEITLPSGATVKLRDAESLLIKDRNKVMSIANNEEGAMMTIALQNGLMAVMVVEWSFDLIPPNIRLASLEELTPKDYDALLEAVVHAQDFLFPSITGTEVNEQDPKASTANSLD